jgi:nitric oxide synthase oxygenase domain/subunit
MAEAKTKTKAQTTAEPTAENEVIHAARAWTETLREAGKTVADSAIAIQDRNVHFTQSVVDQGLKQIEDQAATLRKLYANLASQSDERRAAFRQLAREAGEAYISLLGAPVRLARRAVERAQETAKQDAANDD